MVFEKSIFKPAQVAQQIGPLTSYLDEQDRLLDELCRVLENERISLRDRKMKELGSLTEHKSSLMLKLQSNDQRIKLHPDAALLKSSLRSRVEKIKLSLQMCKRRNEVNGKLIKLCMNTTRRVYSLLMESRDRNTKNLTYTDKGSITARGMMRLSIQA
ncbi:MAG: flagellar protein FlgN [Succinivibrio sp.]|nr:flagellar protein FlgN [Succinivibrio sp.]